MGMGERVQQLIESKGLTAYELSIRTGISQASISRIINNETKKLGHRNIELLAEYFNTSAEWLRTGKGDDPVRVVDTGPPKALTQEERIDRLILMNERLVEQNGELIRAISKNADTINTLSQLNIIGEQTVKKAGGGVAP